jgi:hypothetical protein
VYGNTATYGEVTAISAGSFTVTNESPGILGLGGTTIQVSYLVVEFH